MNISTISPTKFDTGKSVTLSGTGFGSSQGTVTIGGQAQTVTSWSDEEIVFTSVRGAQSMGACRVDVVAGAVSTFPYDASRTITQTTKYYVSPTGSDSAAGTLAAPFATITKAWQSVSGADTAIILLDGTHIWDSVDTKFIGAAGTAGAPNLVTSYPGHAPVIDCNGAAVGISVEKSYWHFTHLKFTNYVSAIKFGLNNTTSNCRADYILGETTLGGDNCGLIQIWSGERCTGFVGTYIKGVNTGSGLHQNTGHVYVDRQTDDALTLFNMEFHGGPIGLHWKKGAASPSSQTAAVDNLFAEGQTRWAMGPNPSGAVFTNCLFGDGAGVLLPAANGGEAGDLNTFEHCTFYDGITLASETAGATNNKIHNCVVMSLNKQSLSTITTDSDYNLFPTSSITRDGSANTLAQWRTNNSSDANSVEGTPDFVGSDFTTAAAYALNAGSPGEGAASDATDIGCDVTTVGV